MEPAASLMPSLEQLVQVLKDGIDAGADAGGTVPEDLQDMLRAVQQSKGKAPDMDQDAEKIVPQPGFVVKTTNLDDDSKLFINVCAADNVPAPCQWSGDKLPEEVSQALESNAAGTLSEQQREALRFPLSMGPLRMDLDAKGQPCSVVDCVFNFNVMAAAHAHRPLKLFLLNMALSWAKFKHKLNLDTRWKMPKLRYKGSALEVQYARKERSTPLVAEVPHEELQPTFALRASSSAAASRKASAAAAPRKATGKEAAAAGMAAAACKAGRPSTSSPLPPPSSSQMAALAAAPVASGAAPKHTQRPAAGALAATTGEAGRLKYRVEYEGRPVQAVRLEVELGPHADAADVSVEVEAMRVHVSVPGLAPLVVALPLIVSAEGAKAELLQAASGGGGSSSRSGDGGAVSGHQLLHVTLPFLPLHLLWKQARAGQVAAMNQGPQAMLIEQGLDLEGCGVLAPL